MSCKLFGDLYFYSDVNFMLAMGCMYVCMYDCEFVCARACACAYMFYIGFGCGVVII